MAAVRYIRTTYGSVLALAAVALVAALLALPSTASAQDPVTGQIAMTSQFGQPARNFGTMVYRTTPGAQTTVEGGSSPDGIVHLFGPVGTTYRVLVRGQNSNGDGTWDTYDCPGFDAPQVEITVTLGPDSAANAWTLNVPAVVSAFTAPEIDADEQRFLDLLNAQRAAAGVGPVSFAERLNAAADAQATNIASRPNGSPFSGHAGAACEGHNVRYAELGGTNEGFTAEVALANDKCTPVSADAALASFLGSRQHRTVLMNPYAGVIGVAHVGGVWIGVTLQGQEAVTMPLPGLPRVNPLGGCNSDYDSSDQGDDGGQPTTTLKKASFRSLKVKRSRTKVVVTGALRPARAGETITVKIGRKHVTVRTSKTGAFKATLRVRAKKGAKVTVSVRAHAGVYKAASKTIRLR